MRSTSNVEHGAHNVVSFAASMLDEPDVIELMQRSNKARLDLQPPFFKLLLALLSTSLILHASLFPLSPRGSERQRLTRQLIPRVSFLLRFQDDRERLKPVENVDHFPALQVALEQNARIGHIPDGLLVDITIRHGSRAVVLRMQQTREYRSTQRGVKQLLEFG